MQIIQDRALLFRSRAADQITALIPKSKVLEDDQILVNWGFEEVQLLRNLGNNSPWLTRPELVEVVAGSAALAGREQRRVSNFTVRATLKRPVPAAPATPAPAAGQPPGKV